jgi:hypothetical protein
MRSTTGTLVAVSVGSGVDVSVGTGVSLGSAGAVFVGTVDGVDVVVHPGTLGTGVGAGVATGRLHDDRIRHAVSANNNPCFNISQIISIRIKII